MPSNSPILANLQAFAAAWSVLAALPASEFDEDSPEAWWLRGLIEGDRVATGEREAQALAHFRAATNTQILDSADTV